MTMAVRGGAAAVAILLSFTLAACSDDEVPAAVETHTEAPSPTATVTTPAATPDPTETPTETAPPTETAEPTSAASVPAEGAGPAEVAEFLPEGFPIPDELTVTGDPTATEDNWQVRFSVPDPSATFDFYRTALPEAGYELLPGTSETYSTEVFSGAILAQSDEHDLNLLIVDDEVEITITRR